nr:SOS response-associated peptidase family protein [Sulfitobacter brevis]
MRRLFDVPAANDLLGNAEPLRAIYPKNDGPVVRVILEGSRDLKAMHWGFVMPQKSKKTGDPIQPKAINNARDDKIRISRFWKASFESRRCLVPATSFGEAQRSSPRDIKLVCG